MTKFFAIASLLFKYGYPVVRELVVAAKDGKITFVEVVAMAEIFWPRDAEGARCDVRIPFMKG